MLNRGMKDDEIMMEYADLYGAEAVDKRPMKKMYHFKFELLMNLPVYLGGLMLVGLLVRKRL